MLEQYNFAELENMSEDKQQKFVSSAMYEQRQREFYKNIRSNISNYIEQNPNSKYINYLVVAPDFFHLLCKLLSDNRVTLHNKLYVAAAIFYFTSPLDIIIDMIPGIGFMDDVIIAMNVIKSLLDSVDKNIIKEHWVGDDNVIDMLENLLDKVDTVVSKGLLEKIKSVFTK